MAAAVPVRFFFYPDRLPFARGEVFASFPLLRAYQKRGAKTKGKRTVKTMSKYVGKMRAVLAALNTKAMTTGNAIEAAHDQLSVANANEKVWALREQLQQAATSARDQIATILQEATEAAKKWGELDGRKVDTTDLELLRGDFNLDDEALHRLLVKHQHNGVMINAIAKYAKEHRIPLGSIPTVEGKIQAYHIMADGAGKMIGNIVQSMGTDTDALAEWGKSGNVSQRIEMALYGIR